PLVNNTDGFYPKVTWIPYPKTGQKNSACRAGVVDVETEKTQWIELPGDSRNHYLARMEWADSSQELLLQQLNREQNTNLVMLYDVGQRKLNLVITERDEAWVDVEDDLHLVNEGKRFVWISERDGWKHIYLVSRDGTKTTLASPGDFDVI
ncbi:MAG: DPP IV N-terminal domain-containing protein, partial [Planctomycetaceae bacterium]|nr:DPP IV N-terminal domain-containing protein [Planctomycetaceae bacterium]